MVTLPGQRYDSNTGFNYNYFRDYDPSTGRYVQSDPIGLLGGQATYAYGFLNPGTVIDPNGLQSAPGLGDQFNPSGLRGNGEADYSSYFETRFPNTISGAKALFSARIKNRACAQIYTYPTSLPAMNSGADDIDIQSSMSRFGDKSQGWYERNVQIGAFELKTTGISIKWDSLSNACPSCFSFGATMYVSENTGDNRISGVFRERTVVMGRWTLSGRACCGQ